MPGREAARFPLPLGHTLHPESAASSDTCVVLATPWGGITHPCTGEGLWAARREPQVMRVPAGSTVALPITSSAPCGAWGWGRPGLPPQGRQTVAQSSAWPRVLSPAEHWLEDAVGWGSPHGRSWPHRGPSCVGTCLPVCVWHPAVAGQGHSQLWWQECPGPGMARWHQGTQGEFEVQVPSLCSIAELGEPPCTGCTNGMWACCAPPELAPVTGPCVGVTIPAHSRTWHTQGRIRAVRGRGWLPRQEW